MRGTSGMDVMSTLKSMENWNALTEIILHLKREYQKRKLHRARNLHFSKYNTLNVQNSWYSLTKCLGLNTGRRKCHIGCNAFRRITKMRLSGVVLYPTTSSNEQQTSLVSGLVLSVHSLPYTSRIQKAGFFCQFAPQLNLNKILLACTLM